jgi:hypothetical protein
LTGRKSAPDAGGAPRPNRRATRARTATAERAYRDARSYATANPGTAAAVTFATGIGVGMMLAPRSAFRVGKRALVPVVAIAIAHAVLDVFDQPR